MYHDLLANLNLESLFCRHCSKFGKCILFNLIDLFLTYNRVSMLGVEPFCLSRSLATIGSSRFYDALCTMATQRE